MIFKKRKPAASSTDEPKTRIDPFPGSSSETGTSAKPGKTISATVAKDIQGEPPTRDAVFDAPVLSIPAADDPQVGMVTIIEGPGRGFSAPLSYGDNLIGRGSGMDVRLDFGDADLSETAHAAISYDEESRHFHIRSGPDGSDLTVGKKIVEKPHKLKDRDRIMMGNTVLLFVGICGPTFDWRAEASGTKD